MNYVNKQDDTAYMQDDYMYVHMQIKNQFTESDFYMSNITFARILHHRCKMQQKYDNMRLSLCQHENSLC